MNLSDYFKYIDPVVFNRGKKYASDGRVISLASTDEGKYTSIVRGNEDYEVYVELDDEGNIIESACDCPYDIGEVCKHQVAVFFELKNGKADEETMPEPSLRELLEAEEKEKLIELLLYIVEESSSAEDRIRLQLSKKAAVQELDDCRRLIRSYIEDHSDQTGFVSWHDVSGAVEGAEIVAEKALTVLDEGRWLQGQEILLCIIEEMIELLQSADDSGGVIASVIESSLRTILEQVQKRDHIPDEVCMEMFRRLLLETGKPHYDGWSDWQLTLLEAANVLVESEGMQRIWDKAADLLLDQTSEDNWSRNYISEEIAVLRYSKMLEHSDGEQEKDYLNKHLQYPKIREIAIQAALEHGDAEEAIRLAEEGDAQQQGLSRTGNRWKKYRYEGYRRTGQVERRRKLGMELIVSNEFTYYAPVKDTFSDEGEWNSYLQELLDQLEQNLVAENTYIQILQEEGMFARLLEHVRKAPYRIASYYKQLLPHYPEEVRELFVAYIDFLADQSQNRRDYAGVCRVIRLLQQIGGQKEAFAVTQSLLAKYPRRPAFQEELGKLRLT